MIGKRLQECGLKTHSPELLKLSPGRRAGRSREKGIGTSIKEFAALRGFKKLMKKNAGKFQFVCLSD